MNRQKAALFIVTVALVGGTAGLLSGLRGHQRLGLPGVRTQPSGEPNRLRVELPERVLDYQSDWVEVDELAKKILPPDTSFGQRLYRQPDGFKTRLNVVLMGCDRTSLHKPQFCLTGLGCQIDQAASTETTVHVEQPLSYELPVVELVASRQVTIDGQHQIRRVIYVYWFVAEDQLSASVSGFERMWSMATILLRTGVLQRWAYVSCLAECSPGQEQATFERMKNFIAAAVPEFQLTPKPAPVALRVK